MDINISLRHKNSASSKTVTIGLHELLSSFCSKAATVTIGSTVPPLAPHTRVNSISVL